ncbi:hypothetical protein D3C86_2230310 [compost metagenome]
MLHFPVYLGVIDRQGQIIRPAGGTQVQSQLHIDEEPLSQTVFLRQHTVISEKLHPV